MTARRLLVTVAVMAAAANGLVAVAPTPGTALVTLLDLPATGRADAEGLVLAAAGLLAWLTWAWGSLGLALTAASALPGLLGAAAGGLTRAVVPAGLRGAAAVALGVGVVVAAPAAAAGAPGTAAPSAPPAGAPDWPSRGGVAAGPLDWPSDPSRQPVHVVVAGDCLWDIAETRLRTSGVEPTDADVVRAVRHWWQANADVIGPDPDLIHPGQELGPPAGPSRGPASAPPPDPTNGTLR